MLAAIVNSLSRHHIDASEDDTVSPATRDRGTGTAVRSCTRTVRVIRIGSKRGMISP